MNKVVQVVHLVLNTLQDPHLFIRVVDVVDGDGAIWYIYGLYMNEIVPMYQFGVILVRF